MIRRSLTALCLSVLFAGCGSEELRSPECDDGKPVVASGRIVLEDTVSSADVSQATVELKAGEGSTSIVLSSATLESPNDFPLEFKLCADVAGVDASSLLYVSATLERSLVQAAPASGGTVVARTEGGVEDLEVTVRANHCYCGPACDPACGFDP